MPASNPYAAGTPVYRGGSSAATMGRVDPMGYIDRSLNQVANPSPLAASAALRQRTSPTSYTPRVFTGAPATGLPSTASGGIKAITGPYQPTIPPHTTTPTGQIILDPDLLLQQQAAQNDYNNQAAQLALQDQLAELQNYSQQRDLRDSQTRQQRGDLNSAAGRGMAYSSGYGEQVLNTGRQYQNAFSDLAAALAGEHAQSNQAKLAAQLALQNIIQQLQQQQTSRSADKAGTGAITPPVPTPGAAGFPAPGNIPTTGTTLKWTPPPVAAIKRTTPPPVLRQFVKA